MTTPSRHWTNRIADTRGIALIGVIVLGALLMALAVAMALAVRSDTQLRGAFGNGLTGFYAAESGLNKGMGEYRNIFLNYNVPNGSDFNQRTFTLGTRTVKYQIAQQLSPAPCVAGCSVSGGCQCQSIVIPQGQTFGGLNATQYLYTQTSTSTNSNNEVEASVGADFLVGYIPLFQFVAFYANDLEIAPGPPMNLQGRVHTNGNLYLSANPGEFDVSTNPPAGIVSITVTAAKNINRGRKYQNICDSGSTVQVATLAGTLKPIPCNGSSTRVVPSSELATWNGSMTSNLGNISVPAPSIIQPPSGITNNGQSDCSNANCDYWEKADLRIVLHVGQNDGLPGGKNNIPYKIEVFNSAGIVDAATTTQLKTFMADAAWNQNNSTKPGTMPIFVTDVPTACGGLNTPGCANYWQGASYNPSIPQAATNPSSRVNNNVPVNAAYANSGAYTEIMGNQVGTFDLDYRRGGFFNWRENKWMILLNVNVTDLIRWNSTHGAALFANTDGTSSGTGGIVIYATVDGPSSNAINNYGVRVFGSSNLPVPPLPGGIGVSADPTGVTVVSDQAMYVLGNFNSPAAGQRQPASLVGDSVNVLSEGYWLSQTNCNARTCRDGQSVGVNLANRGAAQTTVNAAFLGGVDTTPLNAGSQASYNGGLENYPRFHEDWSGIPFFYQGSFVSLGTPNHVIGAWCGTGNACNIYNPPNRNWNYDSAFNNAANLPPLTPRFVYVQQVLFTENFK